MDGREERPYSSVTTPLFSPDGRHMSYVAQKGGSWTLVTDGKEGPAFSEVANPAWSPNSQHVAYMIKKNGAWSVCVDGKTAPTAFQGFLKGSSLDFIGPNRLRALALRQ